MIVVRRGDVYYADLSPVVGSEQGGTRPVLIIQNDIGNRFSPTVIVAAITAQIQKAKLPTHVEIDAKKYGFGEGYKYSHDYPDEYQQFLPDELKNRKYI